MGCAHPTLLEDRARAIADPKWRRRLEAVWLGKRAWYASLLDLYGDRIEPIDLPVAQKWAEVSARFPSMPDGDKAIAATALAKGYGVASQNLGDFRNAGWKLVDPLDPATSDEDWDDDPIAPLLRK